MAGKKKKRLDPATTSNDSDERMSTEKTKESMVLQSWSDTPIELMENIFSKLELEDNIRVSAVCKSWYNAALSVRVVGQSPWLMYFPRSGDTYGFFDPSERKDYSLDLPELYDSRVCCSKDGWLLLHKPRTHRLFFFNPFTREKVKLLKSELAHQVVSFSCAPTSLGCVVFTVEQENYRQVVIRTTRPGEKAWVISHRQSDVTFVSSMWNKVVFSNGKFYVLSLTGWIGVYETECETWTVLSVPPPWTPSDYLDARWWKGKFLTVHNGQIIVIFTCGGESPTVFKLVQLETEWEEMNMLNGMTIFAGFSSSHSIVDLLGEMRNNVYFPKVRLFGKRCISYSLDKNRYYPCKQLYDWGEIDPFETVWIEPPPNASSLMEAQ